MLESLISLPSRLSDERDCQHSTVVVPEINAFSTKCKVTPKPNIHWAGCARKYSIHVAM